MIEKISFAEISKESSIIRQMARIINDLIGAIDKLEKHKHSYFDTQKYQTTLVSTSTPIVEDKPECEVKPPLGLITMPIWLPISIGMEE